MVNLVDTVNMKFNENKMKNNDFSYYHAMHFSAKRGPAIACRLSVCL